MNKFDAGDRVEYIGTIRLQNKRGTVVKIHPESEGSDCTVEVKFDNGDDQMICRPSSLRLVSYASRNSALMADVYNFSLSLLREAEQAEHRARAVRMKCEELQSKIKSFWTEIDGGKS
jgi:hypothetical protein